MELNQDELQGRIDDAVMLEQIAATFSLRHKEVFHIGAEYLNENGRIAAEALDSLGEHHEKSKQHSLRVFLLALDMGLDIDITAEELHALGIAAALHDIGKLQTDLTVLAKPGELTPEEREIMKEHVKASVTIVESLYPPHADAIKKIVSHHHGYDLKDPYFGMPEGASGDGAPDERLELLRQTLAAADVFDALSSARDYREPLSKEKVKDILYAELGVDEKHIARVLERFLDTESGK